MTAQKDVPCLMNVFYVGHLKNKAQVKNTDETPNFEITFSFSAGFNKKNLVEICRQMEYKRVRFAEAESVVNYKFHKRTCVGDIDYMFIDPIVVSLKGSSYEYPVATGCWVLRHPRLLFWNPPDTCIIETISFAELQVL